MSSLFLLSNCKKKYTPKPRGFFRIDLPEKEYTDLNKELPHNFQAPKYIEIHPDHSKYWINIDYPEYKGRIHLSYHSIENNLPQLLEDTRKFVYKHTIKADAISEQVYDRPEENVHGILYEIDGNAASSVQFFLTDSTENFLRGALYFYVEPNKDSLAPVIDFIKKDIRVLMESFEWKDL